MHLLVADSVLFAHICIYIHSMNESSALFNFGRSPFVANKHQAQKHFYNFRLFVIKYNAMVDIVLKLVMFYFLFCRAVCCGDQNWIVSSRFLLGTC